MFGSSVVLNLSLGEPDAPTFSGTYGIKALMDCPTMTISNNALEDSRDVIKYTEASLDILAFSKSFMEKQKKIIIKSPAKINLHLEVIGKREDGFHELAMIMQNIDLSDYLEFEINNEGLIKLESDCNDLSLSDDNLIVKSANLLRKKLNIDYGANIFLRKNIPIGAGLAGGSSNAAATLIGLNKLWDLNLDQETLCSLASTLGSDIPFFINGGIQLCFGRGEILEKLDSNFEYGVILLKNPNVSVSTAETYKKYSNRFCDQYLTNRKMIENIRKNLRDNGLNNLNFDNQHLTIKNDLQLVVENENDSVKQALYLLSKLENCLTFSMSGSGPTCFALFKEFFVTSRVLSIPFLSSLTLLTFKS